MSEYIDRVRAELVERGQIRLSDDRLPVGIIQLDAGQLGSLQEMLGAEIDGGSPEPSAADHRASLARKVGSALRHLEGDSDEPYPLVFSQSEVSAAQEAIVATYDSSGEAPIVPKMQCGGALLSQSPAREEAAVLLDVMSSALQWAVTSKEPAATPPNAV